MGSASVQTVGMGLPIANRDRSLQNWHASTSDTVRAPRQTGEPEVCRRRYHSGQPCRQNKDPISTLGSDIRGRLAHK